ncbi:MAG: hypothetical protein RR232_00195 [Clostridia bacterium]
MLSFKSLGARYTVMILSGLILFGLGTVAGFYINGVSVPPETQIMELPSPPEAEQNVATVDVQAVARITATTQIKWMCGFSTCGHEIEADAESELIGMSEAEVKSACPGYQVTEFSQAHVILKKNVEGYCPQHFILKLAGDELHVLQTDKATLKSVEVMKIELDAAKLSEEVRTELEKGLPFDDLEQINAYFEAAES